MKVLALDIGGANIKAAWGVVGAGAVRDVEARSFPNALWKAPAALAESLKAAARDVSPELVLATMTGELCDCFAGRREGVTHILKEVGRFAGRRPVLVWLVEGRFVSLTEARLKWLSCASANWMAQAAWVAGMFSFNDSLLIDTGSTTTDIALLRDGAVVARGYDDFSRRAHGELIYTGASRTPLMSLSPISLKSATSTDPPVHLMAELFATTADVYVLTGDRLPERENHDTADGRALSREAAAVRVLRMMGTDLETMTSRLSGHVAKLAESGAVAGDVCMRMAVEVAEGCALVQRQRIAEGIRRVVEASRAEADSRPFRSVERVVVAGSGDFVAKGAALMALPGVEVIRLSDRIGQAHSASACAVGLLHMLARNPGTGVPGL